MGYKVILILRNNQRFFILNKADPFFKIVKVEDRFVPKTFSAARTQYLIYIRVHLFNASFN